MREGAKKKKGGSDIFLMKFESKNPRTLELMAPTELWPRLKHRKTSEKSLSCILWYSGNDSEPTGIKFGTDIHAFHRMSQDDFGDPLRPSTPPMTCDFSDGCHISFRPVLCRFGHTYSP